MRYYRRAKRQIHLVLFLRDTFYFYDRIVDYFCNNHNKQNKLGELRYLPMFNRRIWIYTFDILLVEYFERFYGKRRFGRRFVYFAFGGGRFRRSHD
jgi:hypothetical protein